ncbi:MAG: fibronectin type III domain-containing protein [Candidatus Omnitrophica bacterium]|nr:fibronectin type III domain-containing protein [Candidatus Omnitrophota bacterium]
MKFSYFLILILSLLLAQCTHVRDNPYDPGATNYLPLSAPQNLTAQPLSSREIRLSWITGNSRAEGFVIARGLSGSTLTPYAVLPINANSFSDTNCTPYTQYYYNIGAFDKLADTIFPANQLVIRTLYQTPLDMPETGTLQPPASLILQRTSHTGIKLVWPQNSQAISGYVIQKGTRPDSLFYLAQAQSSSMEYLDTLRSATTCYYALRAFNTTGVSPKITDSIKPMVKPESLHVALTSDNRLQLSWQGNEQTTDSICIEKKTTPPQCGYPLPRQREV